MTRRVLEIESLAAFDAHVRRARNLNGWFVQSLDLTERVESLLRLDPRGAVFLGCRFSPVVEAHLSRAGALIFPRLPDLPFDPYRGSLYDAAELYGAGLYGSGLYGAGLYGSGLYGSGLYGSGPYRDSRDAAIYAWARSQRSRSLAGALSTTLHDHAITDALDDATETIAPRRVVGIMGGHALLRTDPAYAAAVRLAATLCAAGRLVLTGGGPGAMEAGNLGAYLSPWSDAVPEALGLLATAPAYAPSVDAWVAAAYQVRDRWPVAEAGRSLSIPTWFYGHEPTNPFATMIAKYFANALREDTLLHRCRGGIVFFPGQAGTVQEIFQAVTENFYAAGPTLVAPMILIGVDYWTKTCPAWPLLQRLGDGRAMGRVIHCVDDVATVPPLLADPSDSSE